MDLSDQSLIRQTRAKQRDFCRQANYDIYHKKKEPAFQHVKMAETVKNCPDPVEEEVERKKRCCTSRVKDVSGAQK